MRLTLLWACISYIFFNVNLPHWNMWKKETLAHFGSFQYIAFYNKSANFRRKMHAFLRLRFRVLPFLFFCQDDVVGWNRALEGVSMTCLCINFMISGSLGICSKALYAVI